VAANTSLSTRISTSIGKVSDSLISGVRAISILSNLHHQCIGPKSQLSLQQEAYRNLVSRLQKYGIHALVRSPLSRILAPAWRLILRRVDELVDASLHRIFPSKMSLPDSQLNLPDHSNYIAIQKLADGYSTQYTAF
jgi:hypothetical protein